MCFGTISDFTQTSERAPAQLSQAASAHLLKASHWAGQGPLAQSKVLNKTRPERVGAPDSMELTDLNNEQLMLLLKQQAHFQQMTRTGPPTPASGGGGPQAGAGRRLGPARNTATNQIKSLAERAGNAPNNREVSCNPAARTCGQSERVFAAEAAKRALSQAERPNGAAREPPVRIFMRNMAGAYRFWLARGRSKIDLAPTPVAQEPPRAAR